MILIKKLTRQLYHGKQTKADLNILRLAYYEMNIDDDIPKPVAVDQAVELAKKYGTDDSPSFVNGVLAKLFQEIIYAVYIHSWSGKHIYKANVQSGFYAG